MDLEPPGPYGLTGVDHHHSPFTILHGPSAHSRRFGDNPAQIHGIQYVPFTPMSEVLLGSDWIRESYPLASSDLVGMTPCWFQVHSRVPAALLCTLPSPRSYAKSIPCMRWCRAPFRSSMGPQFTNMALGIYDPTTAWNNLVALPATNANFFGERKAPACLLRTAAKKASRPCHCAVLWGCLLAAVCHAHSPAES